MRYIDADLIPWTDIAEGTPMKKPIKVLITFADKVNRMPTADVRPNVRGEWSGESGWEECSECHWVNTTHLVYHFCPNCGADMRQVGGNTE